MAPVLRPFQFLTKKTRTRISQVNFSYNFYHGLGFIFRSIKAKNGKKWLEINHRNFFTKSRIFDFLFFHIFGRYSEPNWHRGKSAKWMKIPLFSYRNIDISKEKKKKNLRSSNPENFKGFCPPNRKWRLLLRF